jgi:hypothetical protein
MVKERVGIRVRVRVRIQVSAKTTWRVAASEIFSSLLANKVTSKMEVDKTSLPKGGGGGGK